MARSAIPDFGTEYPEWVYQPWPKYVGLDAEGGALIAKNQDEYDDLLPTRAFPKLMGKDKAGKDVIAQIPRDLEWLKGQVVTPPEDPAVVAKREADATFEAAETKRKAAAYDALMAGQKGIASGDTVQSATSNPLPADSGPAQNALTAPTGLKKSKAA